MPTRRRRPDEISLAPGKAGRPRKLHPDDATIKTLKALAKIHCTTKEYAAALGVTEPTFLKFRDDYPEIIASLDEGNGLGKISLRRTQFALASKNAAMAIFLGKNLLGQTDKLDVGGEINVPVRFVVMRTRPGRPIPE